MKTMRMILTLLLGIAIIIGTGFATEAYCEAQIVSLDDLQTLEEQQTILYQLGYLKDVNDIDLVCGPKTHKALERAECQKAYLETINRKGR